MGVLDSVGDISSILAAYEANKAKGNIAQGDAQQRQANAAANIYRTQADVALKGPEQSARATALGDQMANIQPFSWTGDTKQVGNIPVPQSVGGLSPANFGPNTRRAGSELSSLSADRVSSPTFNLPQPPTLAPLPSSSGLDSILSNASLIGSLAKAAAGNGGGGNIADLIKKLFPGGGGSPLSSPGSPLPSGNPGMNGFTGWDDGNTGGYDPNQDRGPADPTASVDTSTSFNGVPGGFPNSPEDPLSADPEWWRQFLENNGGGGGDTSGFGMEPSAEWGG